jgi:hypothetical protein
MLAKFSGIGETEPEAGLLTPRKSAHQLAKELHQLLNNRRDRVEHGAGLTDRA